MDFYDKKAILFDLDGTLIDSVPDLAKAINYMLNELGLDTKDEIVIRQWVGNGASVLVERALLSNNEVNINMQVRGLKIFLDYYGVHLCDGTQIYKGIASTLEELKSEGFRLVVVTNKPILFVSPILKKLALDTYFEFFIGGDSLEKRKPDSLPLTFCAQKLGLKVTECVMIGDSKNDIIAAQNAQMQSIGVTYGYNYNQPISEFNPDFVVEHFSDILKIFIK